MFALHILLIWIMESRQVNPSDVIILEGILVFHDPRVRGLMNMKIFVDTGPSSFILLAIRLPSTISCLCVEVLIICNIAYHVMM